MAFDVRRVPSVGQTVKGFDRVGTRAYEAARDNLKGQGCKGAGKRLAATDGSAYPMCQRDLHHAWRMHTVFLPDDVIVIVSIDEHTDSSSPSAVLAEIFAGLSAVGRRRSAQPPCCDDPAQPPLLSAETRSLVEELFGL